jgi:predicted HAD superfamily Cof-like phosphohydrolase
MNLSKVQSQVRQFHEAFGHPVADSPKVMTEERRGKRYNWMKEELDEFKSANKLVDQADAIADIIYLAVGTAVELGIDIERIVDIVHQANMNKLGPDGKPIYKPDGKIAKPEGWVPPEPLIQEELERQMKEKTQY